MVVFVNSLSDLWHARMEGVVRRFVRERFGIDAPGVVRPALRFDYRLTGTGWSEATISDDRSSATVTASYLQDALGNLLEAVGVLLEGAAEARCSWEEEPGEFRWVFERQGADVHLRLLGFRDCWARQPDRDGNLTFETTQRLDDLAAAVADGAQRVLDEYGLDGYLAKWLAHPFPAEYLALIRAHLAA